MFSYEEYYERLKDAKYHKLMEKINKIEKEKIQNVIELGCGIGRDTIFLMEKRLFCFGY